MMEKLKSVRDWVTVLAVAIAFAMVALFKRKSRQLEQAKIEVVLQKENVENEKAEEHVASLVAKVETDDKDRLEKEAIANRLLREALDPGNGH